MSNSNGCMEFSGTFSAKVGSMQYRRVVISFVDEYCARMGSENYVFRCDKLSSAIHLLKLCSLEITCEQEA